MDKKIKVTNYYKLFLLLSSYSSSFEIRGLPKKLNNALAQRPVINKLIKDKYFSDIDALHLKQFKTPSNKGGMISTRLNMYSRLVKKR